MKSIILLDDRFLLCIGVPPRDVPGLLESRGTGISAKTIKRIQSGEVTPRESTLSNLRDAYSAFSKMMFDAIYTPVSLEGMDPAKFAAPVRMRQCIEEFTMSSLNDADDLEMNTGFDKTTCNHLLVRQQIRVNICALASIDTFCNYDEPMPDGRRRSDFIDIFPSQDAKGKLRPPIWIWFNCICTALGEGRPISRAALAALLEIDKNEIDRWANAKTTKSLPSWFDLQTVNRNLTCHVRKQGGRLIRTIMLQLVVARMLQYLIIEYRAAGGASDADVARLHADYLMALNDWSSVFAAEGKGDECVRNPFQMLFDVERLQEMAAER